MLTIKIAGKTYDVTGFVESHPGGKAILDWAIDEKDATEMFYSMHHPSSRAWKVLETLPVIAEEPYVPSDYVMGVQEIQKDVLKTRSAVLGFFVLLFIVTIAPYVVGLYLLNYHKHWSAYISSIILVAYSIQQLGWYLHMVAHKQVFPESFEKTQAACVMSGLLTGYSYTWWREKHNQLHHPSTNVSGKDEDIDTMPLIKWDPEDARMNLFVRYQHYLVWGWLLVARFKWLYDSAMIAATRGKWVQLLCIALYYVLTFLALYASGMGIGKAILWFVMVQIIAGFALGFVFLQSHNAMDVIGGGDEGHVSHEDHTLQTTRNITPYSTWNNIFSGFLNKQVEHHLLPWCPPLFYDRVAEVLLKSKKVVEMNYGESCREIFDYLRKLSTSG